MGDRHDVADGVTRNTYDAKAIENTVSANVDAKKPTGDPLLDEGPKCTRDPGGSGCFLEPSQRLAILNAYQQRTQTAEIGYSSALSDMKLDAVVQKEENDLPWIASLILDVIGAYGLSSLTKALQFFHDADMAELGRAVSSATGASANGVTSVAHDALGLVSEGHLKAVSKAVADKTKHEASDALRGRLAEDKKSKKRQTISYITELQSQAANVFTALREHAPADASDAQLLVMRLGFSPGNHNMSIYKSKLTEKLHRFEKSGVDTLGRGLEYREVPKERPDRDEEPGSRDSPHAGAHKQYASVVRDRIVVRVNYRNGAPSTYAYARLDWANTNQGHPADAHLDTTMPLSLNANRRHPIADILRMNHEPEIEGSIEIEFQDVAVERHLAVWGAPPMVLTRDSPPEPDRTHPPNYVPGKPYAAGPVAADLYNMDNYKPGKPYAPAPKPADRNDPANYMPGKPYYRPPSDDPNRYEPGLPYPSAGPGRDASNANNYLPGGTYGPSIDGGRGDNPDGS